MAEDTTAPAHVAPPPIGLRPMQSGDIALVERWLGEPHVARWWLAQRNIAEELEPIRASVQGDATTGTHQLIVTDGGRPIGWAQWYRWDDDPAEAAAVEASPGDLGIDYAIGDPASIGRGRGTAMIAALVRHLGQQCPGSGIVVDPDARNWASRRVLERNGFTLVAVRAVASEPTGDPMAIYRHAPGDGSGR